VADRLDPRGGVSGAAFWLDGKKSMLSARILKLCAIVGCGILASCQRPPRVEVFNNSNSTISVIVGNEVQPAVVGKNTCPVRITMEALVIETVTENGCLTNRYHLVWPQPFEKYGNRGAPLLRLQYEKNNQLYVLKQTEYYPLSNVKGQPSGFPLLPK
jgi:hypothetical protein